MNNNKENKYLTGFMITGLLIGSVIAVTAHYSIGICAGIGLALGIAIGAAIDSRKNKNSSDN